MWCDHQKPEQNGSFVWTVYVAYHHISIFISFKTSGYTNCKILPLIFQAPVPQCERLSPIQGVNPNLKSPILGCYVLVLCCRWIILLLKHTNTKMTHLQRISRFFLGESNSSNHVCFSSLRGHSLELLAFQHSKPIFYIFCQVFQLFKAGR